MKKIHSTNKHFHVLTCYQKGWFNNDLWPWYCYPTLLLHPCNKIYPASLLFVPVIFVSYLLIVYWHKVLTTLYCVGTNCSVVLPESFIYTMLPLCRFRLLLSHALGRNWHCVSVILVISPSLQSLVVWLCLGHQYLKNFASSSLVIYLNPCSCMKELEVQMYVFVSNCMCSDCFELRVQWL